MKLTFKKYPIITYFITTMVVSILLLIPHLIFCRNSVVWIDCGIAFDNG